MEIALIVLAVVFEVWAFGAVAFFVHWRNTFRCGSIPERPISEGLIAAALWPKFAVEVFLGFLIEMSPLMERILTKRWRRFA